jgi:hypothetical protein
MGTEPVAQTSASAGTRFSQRYRLSWIDRLLAQITRLPGPTWLFYLVLLITLILVNNSLQWLDGTVPTGTFDRVRTTDVVFPLYFLALMHYLNGCAGRALAEFRAVTDLSEADYDDLARNLQTVPAGSALVAGLAGATFVMIALWSDSASFGIFPSSSLLTILVVVGLSLLTGAFLFVFIVHTVRQLILVNQIYRRATRIDLFNLKPVYAFSGLTARAGIGLIFFIYFAVAINGADTVSSADEVTITLFNDLFVTGDIPGLMLVGSLLLTGVAAFVWPLLGIHHQLAAIKDLKMAEVSGRLASVLRKLHRDVEADDFDKMGGIQNALSSLRLEREQLAEISTWPWETGTLRGFVTAILIPILLWLLTRLLERII